MIPKTGATVVLPEEEIMGSTATIEDIERQADAMVEALQDVLLAQTAFICAHPSGWGRARNERNAAILRAVAIGCSIRQVAAKAVLSPGTVQRIVTRSRG